MGTEESAREADQQERRRFEGADATAELEKTKGSRVMGRLLPAAVRLWLRSQVEQVDDLSVSIGGRDRDILSGCLPSVSVSAVRAVYQGIHLGHLRLSAQDIQINLGQIIRRKPLRLLKAFPVAGDITLSADDLNASLGSALLQGGLRDFWRSLAQNPLLTQSIKARYGPLPLHTDMILHQAQIRLGNQCLALSFYPQVGAQLANQPVILGAGLSAVEAHGLQLESPRWLQTLSEVADTSKGEPITALQKFRWNLGSDTQLSELTLLPERLLCKGQLMVNP
jgi:hypothetical protein